MAALVVPREEAEGEEREDDRELEQRCQPDGGDHEPRDEREMHVARLLDRARDDAREGGHAEAERSRAGEEIERQEERLVHVHARFQARRGEEDRREDRGEEAVEGDEVQRPLGHLPLGARVLHDEEQDRRRGRHGDRRAERRHHRRVVERDEHGEDGAEGERILRERGGGERPVTLHPLQVHAPAEIEEDEPEREVDEDARPLDERIDAERGDERGDHEADDDVAQQARQAHRTRRLASEHAGDEQQPEEQRIAQREG